MDKKSAAAKTVRATFIAKKGFLCGDHVLYCPDLSKANHERPFYLYCARHNLMHEIDLPTQAAEFIAEFPNGCKASE